MQIRTLPRSLDAAFKASKDYFSYSDEQIAIYDSIGGAAHLDNQYTIFGEVIEDLNVIDSIATVKTGKANSG